MQNMRIIIPWVRGTMKPLVRISLAIMITFCMGANWDMSGLKPKWDMVGDEKPTILISAPLTEELSIVPDEPARLELPAPTKLELPEPSKYEEAKSTKPVSRTYPKRRIFSRIFSRKR